MMLGSGQHFMLDLYGCSEDKLSSTSAISTFLNDFPKKISMTKVSEPAVFPYNGGVSGVILVSESHISIHTFPEKGQIFVDIFSCKDIDINAARDELQAFFCPSHLEEEYTGNLPDVKSLAGSLHV